MPVARVPGLLRIVVLLAMVPMMVTMMVGQARASGAQPTLFKLGNGLTVIYVHNQAQPVVAVSAFVDTGSRTEDRHFSGALHLIEHLVFKGGTKRFPPMTFRKRIMELGQESGGWTSWDAINFGFTVPRENLPAAMDVFADSLLHLSWDRAKFGDEKRVVLQELEKYEEDPGDQLWKAFYETAFTVHPYTREIGGTRSGVAKLTMEEVHDYWSARFVPNHIVLAVVGDIERDALEKLLAAHFGSLPRGRDSFELGIAQPAQKEPRRVEHPSPNTTQTRFVLGFVAPPAASPDAAALTLLAWLLSSGSEGLDAYLTKGRQWVTSVSAGLQELRDASVFSVTGECSPAAAGKVTDWLAHFVTELDVARWPEGDFEAAKRRFAKAYLADRETFAQQALRLGERYTVAGETSMRDFADRIAKLTRAQLQDVVHHILRSSRSTLVLLVPQRQAKSGAPLDGSIERSTPPYAPPPTLDVPGLLRPAAQEPLQYTREQGPAGTGCVRFRFWNGLTLVVDRSAASAVVSVSARVLGGQVADPPGKEGLAWLMAALLLRGTQRFDRDTFERLCADQGLAITPYLDSGARNNTSMQVDYRDGWGLHLQTVAGGLSPALALLKEALFHPTFPAGEVDKEIERQRVAIKDLEEDNFEFIRQEFYDRVFVGHPYGRPVMGTASSLGAIRREDLVTAHDRYMTPDRTCLAVVGDVDPDGVAQFIARSWADLPSTRGAPLPSVDLDRPPVTGTETLARGRNQWTIHLGAPTIARDDPRFVPLLALFGIISSKHFFKYVYEKGVSYRSWFKLWTHRGPSVWICENDLERKTFDASLASIRADIAGYARGEFTDEDLARAKDRMVNSLILERQSSLQCSWGLATAQSNGIGYEEYLRRPDDVRAVTLESVRALAREFLGKRPHFELIMK